MGVKGILKQGIKRILVDRQQKKYDRLLEEKAVSYDAWIRAAEQGRAEGRSSSPLAVKQIPYEACMDYCLGKALQQETADILLFADSDGVVSEAAKEEAAAYFSAHEKVGMAYGDEDVASPEGIRYTPWLKPDWSPDTFLSFFYFGSVFAVRRDFLRALTEEEKKWVDGREGIRRLCYVLAVKSGGFEKRRNEGEKDGMEWNFPIGHIDEILFHGNRNREMELEREPVLDAAGCPAVMDAEDEESGKTLSIIIPSKDHAGLLKRCIQAVQAEIVRGYAGACEVIVVDNGSRVETREELEPWLQEQQIPCKYLYQEMPFHFSRMCNIGAAAAKGDVLLFLNDDVEVPAGGSAAAGSAAGENLLTELERMARRPYTGAVGVKLYYPDSVRIQHAGIVNLRPGPVHKLQFKEDRVSYYYGWNRKRRNVVAVTGACLAVEKKKFREAGGFPEELPVAFNDVDLCFSLMEKGYYNVVLQDFALYHHESLSRGNDDGRDKLERLLGEKDKLYMRHPSFYGKDPFYHKYLAADMLSTGFELRADYEPDYEAARGKIMEAGGLVAGAREDACVMVSLEYAGRFSFWQDGKACGKASGAGAIDRMADAYLLQGYSFVAGSDNALYEKWILLEQEMTAGTGAGSEAGAGEGTKAGRIRCLRPEPMIRRDVEENLPDQVHVGLTGFCAVIEAGELAPGDYRVGILAKDKCSGLRVYSWTERYLKV